MQEKFKMIETFLALFFFTIIGCCLGILTGLIPGLHINALALLLFLFVAQGNEFVLAVIISMSLVHSFVDFIPSILLGVPDENSFLSILPGHKMLLDGNGIKAVNLTVLGGLFSGIFALIFSPVFVLFARKIFEVLPMAIPGILFFVIILMILFQKNKTKTLIVMILSGLLGILVLRNLTVSNSLFPLVTGFFGLSTIIASINNEPVLPKQKTSKKLIGKMEALESSFFGFFSGTFVSLLPSIGSAQAATIIQKLTNVKNSEKYLIILGGINTVNILLSFFGLYAIGITRTGVAKIIKQILFLEKEHFILILAISLISIAFGVVITKKISKQIIKIVEMLPYKKINISVLIFLLILTLVFSGILGLTILLTATSIGFYAITSKINRTSCMTFLMLPTILIYLGV